MSRGQADEPLGAQITIWRNLACGVVAHWKHGRCDGAGDQHPEVSGEVEALVTGKRQREDDERSDQQGEDLAVLGRQGNRPCAGFRQPLQPGDGGGCGR